MQSVAWPAFADTFIAFRKSDIRMPESSIRIKSAAAMPWRCAISNISTMAHSTTSRSGSAGGWCCPILFIAPLYQRFCILVKQPRRMGLKCLLRAFSKLLRISAHPALRYRACTKIATLEVPHCAGTPRPRLFKSAHSFGRRTPPAHTLKIYRWQNRFVGKFPFHY